MPVKPDSRFASLSILDALAPDGTRRQVVALPIGRQPTPVEVRRHVLHEGERPDALARLFYGEERLWWRILDANPLIYPLDLGEPETEGAVLTIPSASPAARINRARRF